MQDGACRGVVAIDLATGELHRFRSHQVILATGGYGRAYFSCTSAHTCTGDGNGMVMRAGSISILPLTTVIMTEALYQHRRTIVLKQSPYPIRNITPH